MEPKTRQDYIMTLQAPFYTIEETAELLNVSWRTVKRRIEEGKLKASKIGQQYRITKENLIAYIDATQN